MIALFAFGVWGFWVVSIATLFLLMALIEFDQRGWATVSVAVVAALLCWANYDAAVETLKNPLLLAAAIAAYLVAGIIWAFAKWALTVKDAHSNMLALKEHFFSGAGKVPGFSAHTERVCTEKGFSKFVKDGQRALGDRYEVTTLCRLQFPVLRPAAKENKARITSWMCYWPISLLNFLVFDFFRRVFRRIYEELVRQFDRVAKRIYPDFQED